MRLLLLVIYHCYLPHQRLALLFEVGPARGGGCRHIQAVLM